MAILDVWTLKDTLRLDVPTDADDATLTALIATGTALVEAYLRPSLAAPIEQRPVTVVLEPRPLVDATTYAITDRMLVQFPATPLVPDTVVVLAPDGSPVDPAAYTADGRTGMIVAVGAAFAPGPHVVTADAGMDLDPEFALRDLPVLQGAVGDFVVWYFEQRNPAAEYESAGGGVATTFNKSADAGLPARIRMALDIWRASRAVPLRRRPIPSRV